MPHTELTWAEARTVALDALTADPTVAPAYPGGIAIAATGRQDDAWFYLPFGDPRWIVGGDDTYRIIGGEVAAVNKSTRQTTTFIPRAGEIRAEGPLRDAP